MRCKKQREWGERVYQPRSNYDRYKNQHKLYCEVIPRCRIGGHTEPIYVKPEENGRWVLPEKGKGWIRVYVLFSEQKAARYAGGQGIAYRVYFFDERKRRYEYELYHDGDDWYLELPPGEAVG